MGTTTESMLNIDLLRKAVQWAEDEFTKAGGTEDQRDEECVPFGAWNQAHWATGLPTNVVRRDSRGREYRKLACGTSYCIAGNACALQGDSFVVEAPISVSDHLHLAEFVIPRGKRNAQYIADRARDLLGISANEATDLFYSENSINDVRSIAADIAYNHGYEL